ncbi:MAG TPA: DUF6311 domain-containing protein [Rhodanobacteraceae bacterium]|nr:DUF6311 domain-containing protein [Rhodanobacteraceae bacterium]
MNEAMPVAGAMAAAAVRVRRVWVALAFGIVFAALSLDPGYVSGRGPYWSAQLGDVAKGEIGWFYYARDAWRFPLFDIGTYHYPEGGSLVLSDSLPLFALPAKIVYKLAYTPEQLPPIYSGFWVVLCLVLQAVAASRLLRALGIRDFVSHLAGIAIFCYLPIVMLRFGQASLMAQCLILFALEGYVRAKREGLTRGGWIAQCALPPLTLLVHPYLAAMCGILVAATILDQWRERHIGFAGVLVRFASIAVLAFAVMTIGGFFSAAMGDFGDYGLYSLNLLSPWIPFPQTLSGRLLGTTLPVIPGTNQWEGGAYLGAGVLLMCVLALPALKNWRANLRRHAVLLALLIATLIFAVSHWIGFGTYEIAHLAIPDVLLHALSQFRGSGRFVWIAVYALVAALIVAIASRYDTRRARLLLIVAALLEIIDVWPMQSGVRIASASVAPSTIDRAQWAKLIDADQRIFVFPSFECGGIFGRDVPGTKFREVEIDWIAAGRNKPINSAYLARFTKDCEREREEAVSNFGEHGVLRLYRSTDETGAFLQQHGADLSLCGYLDDVVVCSADSDFSHLR